jgi:hypothetical protein
MIFYAEIYAFEAFIMENNGRATKVGTSVFCLIVKRP